MDVKKTTENPKVRTTLRQIVLTFDGGGLCNRIFPFANALAAGVEHGWQVVNPVFGRYADYFCGTAVDDYTDILGDGKSRLSVLGLPLWRQRYALARRIKPSSVIFGGDSTVINIDQLLNQKTNDSRFWVNGLYCLASDSFVKRADFLRGFFSPVDMIRDEVASCIDDARTGSDVLVGVHIRQGDYARHYDGMLFYETLEFAALMRQMEKLLPDKNIRFLVCSNVEQSKEDLQGIDWMPGPGSEIADLYALAACDYIIGVPSTYSQWASFYGQVPRYIHNRKYEEKYGLGTTSLHVDDFIVHACGFGRYIGNTPETAT